MSSHQEVEFKTLDGTKLKGRVYYGAEKGAGLVLCPGVSRDTLKIDSHVDTLPLIKNISLTAFKK